MFWEPDLRQIARINGRQLEPRVDHMARQPGVANAESTHARLRKQAEQVYLLTDQLKVQLQALETARVPVTVTFQPTTSGADGHIMALAFIVMMESARSAQEDLKAIMQHVKAVNAAKKELCRLLKRKEKAPHVGVEALDFDAMFCLMATLYTKHLDEEAGELLDSLDSMSEMGETESLRL